MHTHTSVFTHKHTCAYIHTSVYTHTHTHTAHTCTQIYIYMPTNIHTCIWTCTHTTHTHIQIHTRYVWVSNQQLMINIYCQCDSTWKHLGDTPLSTLVWLFQKGLTVRKDLLWIWWQESWIELKVQGRGKLNTSILLRFLTVDVIWPATSCSYAPATPSPPWWTILSIFRLK